MRSVFVVSLASTRKVNLIQDASQPQKQSDSRGKRTNSPCPPDSLRGICYLLKKLLLLAIPPVLVAGEKSGNTGNTDTHLRGSPPSIVVEPGLPTPAMARTNGPGRTRRRFCLRQRLRQWKHLHLVSPKVGLSTCDEARSLLSPCARFIKRTAKGKGIESHKTAALLVLWLSWEHPSCSEKQHVMLANPSDVPMFPGSVKQDPVRAELEERLDSPVC